MKYYDDYGEEISLRDIEESWRDYCRDCKCFGEPITESWEHYLNSFETRED